MALEQTGVGTMLLVPVRGGAEGAANTLATLMAAAKMKCRIMTGVDVVIRS